MKGKQKIRRAFSSLLGACMMLTLLLAAEPAAAFTPRTNMEFLVKWTTTDSLDFATKKENIENCYVQLTSPPANTVAERYSNNFLLKNSDQSRYYFAEHVLKTYTVYDDPRGKTFNLARYSVPIGDQCTFNLAAHSAFDNLKKWGGTLTVSVKNQRTGEFEDFYNYDMAFSKNQSDFSGSCDPFNEAYGIDHKPVLVTETFETGRSLLPIGGTFTPDSTPEVMTHQGYKWSSGKMGPYLFLTPNIVAADTPVNTENPVAGNIPGVTVVSNSFGVFKITVGENAQPGTQFRVAFPVKGLNYGTSSTAYSNVFTIANNDARLSGLSYNAGGGEPVQMPGFAADKTNYDVELPFTTPQNAAITLSPTLADSNAVITENKGVTLVNGTGTAKVVVTAQDGTTKKTYTVNFTVDDPSTYSISYQTNGGVINSGAVNRYTVGTGATLPADVTKKGYAFAGWYTNASFSGTPVTTVSTTDVGNKTFYAKWESTEFAISSYSQSNKTATISSPVSEKQAVVIFAEYESYAENPAEKQLASVQMIPVTLKKGENTVRAQQFSPKAGNEIKIMLWEDVVNLQSLCAAKTIS